MKILCILLIVSMFFLSGCNFSEKFGKLVKIEPIIQPDGGIVWFVELLLDNGISKLYRIDSSIAAQLHIDFCYRIFAVDNSLRVYDDFEEIPCLEEK